MKHPAKYAALCALLFICLLTACGADVPPADTPPEEGTHSPAVSVPVETPSAEVPTETPAEKSEPTETLPEDPAELAEFVYSAIVGAGDTQDFYMVVHDDRPGSGNAITRIHMTADNSWSLPDTISEYAFPNPAGASRYEWAYASPDGAEASFGVSLSSADGETWLYCWEGTDRARLHVNGQDYFLTATVPEDRSHFSLFDTFLHTADSALVYGPRSTIVIDGSFTDYEAVAKEFTRQYAAALNSLPLWAPSRPMNTVYRTSFVSQAYFGEGTENFCAGIGLYLSPEMGMSDWQAGSGMDEETEGEYAGWWKWGMGADFSRNANGDWVCTGMYTGGEMLEFPTPLSEATMEQMVYYFYHTTPGQAHDHLIPHYITEQLPDKVDELGRLLREQGDPTALLSSLYAYLLQHGKEDAAGIVGLKEIRALTHLTPISIQASEHIFVPSDTFHNVGYMTGSGRLMAGDTQVGSIQRLLAPHHSEEFEQGQILFEDGQLVRFWADYDHYIYTDHQFIDGCAAPAVIAHSLYDPPYEDSGAGSTRWVICFAEEDGYLHYRLFLDTAHFTREEAMELARSVTFGHNAFLIPNFSVDP